MRNCWQKNKRVLNQARAQQIPNKRVIIEKHIQHQCNLFHNFVDFKKEFDRVWHAGLWQVLRSFNIEEELLQAIQELYENSSSVTVVLMNSQLGEFFKTTVDVHQRCSL